MLHTNLHDKRILLVIGGGVAAYKALELIRRLRERGAQARCVLTAGAQHFITPLSAASLSAQPVHTELFSLTEEAEMGHIELSRAADLVVVAPATANLLARMAGGLADDLATTLLLATDKRVLVAPAMNVRMWLHPATQRNVAQLRRDGVLFVGPDDGAMACGEFGPGRMAEPMAIIAAIEQALGATPAPMMMLAAMTPAGSLPAGAPAGDVSAETASTKPLSLDGRKVVVTSGPTLEPIDPVRFIANRSSGKQGHAIAEAAARAGARVTLITGPVSIPDPPGVTVVRVENARQMLAAALAALPAAVFVAAAAVADWRVAEEGDQKIKKGEGGAPSLQLVENPDILAMIARAGVARPKLVVGFAAETEQVIAHAQAKLARKGCDFIVANDVGAGTDVMGGAFNTVHLVARDSVESWPRMTKEMVAERLVARIAAMLGGAKADVSA